MAKLLKRCLIVLVPTAIGLIFTWLGHAIASRGHVSPEVSWIVAYGAPGLLIVLTGWMSVRYGELGAPLQLRGRAVISISSPRSTRRVHR